MIVHRAPWVLPIARAPIRDGWVAVENGRVVALGGPQEAAPAAASRSAPPFGADPFAILPGLVNAHTHLELSWMAGQVPPAATMPSWVARLMSLRRTVGHEPPAPIGEAVTYARSCGTAALGDITNTLASYGALRDSPVSGCIFRELLGFNVADADAAVARAAAEVDGLPRVARLRPSIVPHAPYSVSPALLRAIAGASADRIVSIHVAESAEEVEFLRTGGGPWRELLQSVGVWEPAWTPPGCGAVEYLERFGFVNERLLAVHGVQLTAPELDRLAAAGATVVTCPRSNRWTGAGDPPIARFYASGVRVAIGTDSLASVQDLNLFNELAAVRALAAEVPARTLLESATRRGAEALGFGDELGTIAAGRRAELLAVRIPAGVQDVEEYLLSGIGPADVRWLELDGSGGRRAYRLTSGTDQ